MHKGKDNRQAHVVNIGSPGCQSVESPYSCTSKPLDPPFGARIPSSRCGSVVELRTLDYETPGSNPVLRCLNLASLFHSTLLQFTQLYK